MDERVGKPSAAEVGRGSEEPRHPGVEEGVQQVDVQRGREVAGQPGEEEVEDVVVGAEAEREAEHLAAAEEIRERGRRWRWRQSVLGGLGDMRALGVSELWVIAGVAIDAPKQQKVGEADEAGG